MSTAVNALDWNDATSLALFVLSGPRSILRAGRESSEGPWWDPVVVVERLSIPPQRSESASLFIPARYCRADEDQWIVRVVRWEAGIDFEATKRESLVSVGLLAEHRLVNIDGQSRLRHEFEGLAATIRHSGFKESRSPLDPAQEAAPASVERPVIVDSNPRWRLFIQFVYSHFEAGWTPSTQSTSPLETACASVWDALQTTPCAAPASHSFVERYTIGPLWDSIDVPATNLGSLHTYL